MTANDNSVNIESLPVAPGADAARYHHGDLRAALVEQGLRQLAEGGADGLNLRALARSVGVSATAVYRHFADKAALEAALCMEGDAILTRMSRAAQAAAGGGLAGFRATGRAYVRFALAHPGLFRLMMANQCPFERTRGPDDSTLPGGEGMALLLKNVAALTPSTLDPAAQRALVVRAWALVHGLAMLFLDRQIAPDDALIDAVIDVPLFTPAAGAGPGH